MPSYFIPYSPHSIDEKIPFFLHDSIPAFGTLLFSEVIPNMKGCGYAILTNPGRALPTHEHGSYYQLKIVGEHQCHWNKNNLDDKWWLRKAKIFFSKAVANEIMISLCFRIKQSGYHIRTFFWNALQLYNSLQLPCMLMITSLEQTALIVPPLYSVDLRWRIIWDWKWNSILWACRQMTQVDPRGGGSIREVYRVWNMMSGCISLYSGFDSVRGSSHS